MELATERLAAFSLRECETGTIRSKIFAASGDVCKHIYDVEKNKFIVDILSDEALKTSEIDG